MFSMILNIQICIIASLLSQLVKCLILNPVQGHLHLDKKRIQTNRSVVLRSIFTKSLKVWPAVLTWAGNKT